MRLLARVLFYPLVMASVLTLIAQPLPPAPVLFRVQVPVGVEGLVSGRVLVFLKQGSGDQEVNIEEFRPDATRVMAREIHNVVPGSMVIVDGEGTVFSGNQSTMVPGDYEVQAVLDVDHSYNYSGRGPTDWVSAVVSMPHFNPGNSVTPVLKLDSHPAVDPRMAKALAEMQSMVKPGVAEKVVFESPALTKFWGRPTMVQGWVILPPGYAEHPGERYPTVYWTHGFGGNLEEGLGEGLELRQRMVEGKMPPMIWVMLDESCVHGTHEFADSVNNGPWGEALTAEYIPMLEKRYRMDAKPTGRLLNGHSSGGWATLQLQVNYPQVFGGTWSTSPDSSDFHDFTGPNLYAAGANLYTRPDGSAYPIMRMDGKVIATLKQFSQLEAVLGPYGGQIASFEWVFSPRSDSGAPEEMFDRETGAVNPKVVAYWGEHYDLANILERTWAQPGAPRGPMLKGRIHVFVGTADTFYLDGAAHLLDARLQRLGADAHFTFLPGRSHFDLYVVDKDRMGLFDQIAAEMYAVARPGMAWKK